MIDRNFVVLSVTELPLLVDLVDEHQCVQQDVVFTSFEVFVGAIEGVVLFLNLAQFVLVDAQLQLCELVGGLA